MTPFIRKIRLSCLLAGLCLPVAAGAAAGSSPEIYVLNFMHDSVLVFSGRSNGNIRPVRTIEGDGTGLNAPTCVAFDAQGNLYVSNSGGSGGVTVYPPGAGGNAHPIRTITGDNTGLTNGARCLTVDGAGRVYVSQSYGTQDGNGPTIEVNRVMVYPPGANGDVKPIRTIQGGATRMDSVTGLALDKTGNLYAANGGGQINRRDANMRVTVFAPGADGNAAPIRTIEGPDTGLDSSFFLALDATGSLYVANSAVATSVVTMTVYSPGASGDARPVRTLRCASMRGSGTFGNAVAVDGAGDLYMVDLDSPGVFVYPPAARGSISATRTISGSYTQLDKPRFVAVWPLGPAATGGGRSNNSGGSVQ
jgi:hypothetical protein